jgi:hypothetical protein
LKPDHDGWHDVLDSIVVKMKPIIARVFPTEAVGFVEAKCELIAYAAAYEGKLIAGVKIDNTAWNSFVTSVEYRIFDRIDVVPDLSGHRENPDGSRVFISYSSAYVSHMRELENIIDRQYQSEKYEHIELVTIFSPKQGLVTAEVAEEFNEAFERAVLLCTDQVLPTIRDFL